MRIESFIYVIRLLIGSSYIGILVKDDPLAINLVSFSGFNTFFLIVIGFYPILDF